MDDIKILVCYHKQFPVYKNDIYLPIQVGKARNTLNLEIQTDDNLNNDQCDNISSLNHLYCETTAMYWAWKNIRNLYPNIKYVGLCHYRRYFSSEKRTEKDRAKVVAKRIICAGNVLIGHKNPIVVQDVTHSISLHEIERLRKSDDKLKKIITSSDIVATMPVRILNCSVGDFFSTIDRDYIQLMKYIVKNEYPIYYPALKDVLEGSELNAANMIIVRTELLDEYCSYIFGVLSRHLQLVKENGLCLDPINETIYSRVPGYLGELLTCSYIQYKRKTCKVNFTNKFFVTE